VVQSIGFGVLNIGFVVQSIGLVVQSIGLVVLNFGFGVLNRKLAPRGTDEPNEKSNGVANPGCPKPDRF
jgi:hypothetical protein